MNTRPIGHQLFAPTIAATVTSARLIEIKYFSIRNVPSSLSEPEWSLASSKCFPALIQLWTMRRNFSTRIWQVYCRKGSSTHKFAILEGLRACHSGAWFVLHWLSFAVSAAPKCKTRLHEGRWARLERRERSKCPQVRWSLPLAWGRSHSSLNTPKQSS